MVAGSRSSLRRPKLRGDHRSSAFSRLAAEAKPLRPTQSTIALRTKRDRTATLSEQEQDQKRRKISDNNSPPQLRIPLRNRAGVAQTVSSGFVTASVSLPEYQPDISRPGVSLDSPTSKPQYDQIRIIEERARASIRGEGSQTTSSDERRKLRSEHGGSRSKTELAQYFTSFEDMLSLDDPDPEVLTARTRLIIVDDTAEYQPPPSRPDPFGSHKPLHNTQIIDITIPSKAKIGQDSDPLDPEIYLKIHRKAERHEKQMKNGDRERAQHEKYQLERLLDDLRGPDWLKTLGISGITDTEKKRYEPKRTLFIRETQALIAKFKWWKEEEKRRKVEREQALQEEVAQNEQADEEETSDESGTEQDSRSLRSSSTRAPNSSEIDALASQQLLEEAKSARQRKRVIMETAPPLPPPPPPPAEPPSYTPFVSFFSKRHLREAAMSGRQRGRTVLAFGHPVPELDERDFELPETILTDDAIRASQRHRRRLRRGVDD